MHVHNNKGVGTSGNPSSTTLSCSHWLYATSRPFPVCHRRVRPQCTHVPQACQNSTHSRATSGLNALTCHRRSRPQCTDVPQVCHVSMNVVIQPVRPVHVSARAHEQACKFGCVQIVCRMSNIATRTVICNTLYELV